MQKINFSAGPAILPQSVLATLSQSVLNYQNTGLSILEISHRSDAFVEILEGARSLVRDLYQLTDDYEVLFLSGGASTQFCLVPYNLLNPNGLAAYLDTGTWSAKAIKEAQLFGKTSVVASSKDKDYTYVPDFESYRHDINADTSYLHITTNNTVYGTQIQAMPQVDCPIVADMSSDIFSQPLPLPIEKFGVIYAGVQKNTGPAGTTLVIIRKDLLGKVERQIPTILDYRTHINKKSAFNTPPVYAIYGCYLTLKWAKEKTLAQLQKNNQLKASLLYNEIDRNSLFEGNVRKADRSLMNATFRLKDKTLDALFLEATIKADCVGLKGYRTVGGFRASMYNALPVQGVERLVSVMQEFEERMG